MKLRLEYQAADPVAIIELKQDGTDINIYINGEIVAYFYGGEDKTHLALMPIKNSTVSQYVQLDRSGRIVVR